MDKPKTRRERLQARDDKIIMKFLELSEKKYKETKTALYSKELVLEMLGEEFILSKSRVEDIVFGRAYRDRSNKDQLKIDL